MNISIFKNLFKFPKVVQFLENLTSRNLVVPSTQITIPFPINSDLTILKVNRNARAPKLANHGARPCSSVMRRLRKSGNYKRWKEKQTQDSDEQNPKHGHSEAEEDEPGAR